ncbi:hypothetical protein RHGRI_011138 [Rhododendron griersonianum]|uniref:Uncharacterized protein n=1 Tax=Rhododendron griersonianum TaxID=479676 RepID=A0AAV6KLS1_9ERIC|nr:hypothetical protein RHGRI_011138 [Rhododendron griersonianum]
MRRLQWDSNNVEADIRAVLKISEIQIEGKEKAQSEGSIGSPKDIMEEDCTNPTGAKIQKKSSEETQILGREANTDKVSGTVKEITEKGEVVEGSKKRSSGRGYKMQQNNPVVRGGRGRGKGKANAEQTKRKLEVALVEVEIAEEKCPRFSPLAGDADKEGPATVAAARRLTSILRRQRTWAFHRQVIVVLLYRSAVSVSGVLQ